MVAGRAAQPAVARTREHLRELDAGRLGEEAQQRAAQRRALEVDVARLALERRAREDAPREAAVARPGREVVGAGRELGRRPRPGRPPPNEPPDLRTAPAWA